MAQYAIKDRRSKIYEFDHNVLSLLLSNAQADQDKDIFCVRRLKDLFRYDEKNETELVPTLRCYLENNLNISQTYEKLYIARTTCIYRINRIREITHFHFDNPNEVLYLRILLKMYDI